MTMRVQDVMTTEVVSVTPETDFKAIAQLLNQHRINMVPVLDAERRVAGVVTEADLLAKVEWQGRGRPGRIERWLLLEDELHKADGTLAAGIMTRDVASTRPEVTVSHAAQLMLQSHVKALPVVDGDGRMVGIVSRADLLRSFVRGDDVIQRDVEDGVLRGALALEPAAVTVAVKEGSVILKGEVESRSLQAMATRMVEAVPGVVSVFNDTEYRLDDRHPHTASEPADNLTYTGPPLR